MVDVFVYGTLIDSGRATAVLDDFSYEGNATLQGLHRVDGEYPTLAPGGSVDGRILRTPQLDRLDSYEGVDRGLYVRVTVPDTTGEPVDVYVGDPSKLGVDVDWPGDGSFSTRVEDHLSGHDVTLVRE